MSETLEAIMREVTALKKQLAQIETKIKTDGYLLEAERQHSRKLEDIITAVKITVDDKLEKSKWVGGNSDWRDWHDLSQVISARMREV